MTQEMLKFGFLASNVTYVSIEHNKKIVDKYIYYLSKVFKKSIYYRVKILSFLFLKAQSPHHILKIKFLNSKILDLFLFDSRCKTY